jgi:hypothetical protein
MLYSCYGLNIESELAIPELIAVIKDPKGIVAADVIVKFGEVDPRGLKQGKQLGPFLWVSNESLCLNVPNVATFLVSHGNQITIDPAPGVDEDSIRVFLLGSGLGALLFQRGYLVLHGNAIRIGDQCMICVGHSGSGKSTTAAGFLLRGYEVLADDVVAVDANGCALPGIPRIKLWQDVADKLAISTDGLRHIRPGMQKFNFPVNDQFANNALPIRWVYILNSGHTQEINFELIRGLERFNPLKNNTYRVRFMEGLPLRAQHLKRCGQLAGHIHLSRVTRPNHGFELDGLIDAILADIKANP